jgi:hypothetical protein
MAAPSGQLEAHLLRAHQDDDDESGTEEQPAHVPDPPQPVEQPAVQSVANQACPKQHALHAWTFKALKQAAHDFFTKHSPEQQRAAARSKACCIACQELGEELVLQLHAFHSSMPARGYEDWYAWSGLVLDTKQSLAERPDDSSSSKRNKRMLLEAAVYKAASDSASASVFRRALSSLCGIVLAAELATAALGVAAERSALAGARSDARSLLCGLKALAEVCPTFLQAVAAVTRMVQCGQVLSMGSLLVVPLPPVARMEASTRRPRALQLPHLRRCLCSVVQSLRDSVTTATATLTSTIAVSAPALDSSSGGSSSTTISSPSSSLLLSALGSHQEELCTALRLLAAAVAHALAAHSDLAPLCAAVHRIAGLMAAGERQLCAALQDAATATRDLANIVAAAVEPLALQLCDLRTACESALTSVYRAQCVLADAAAPQQAAEPATAVAEVASLLSAASSYYGGEQLDTLAQLQEQATALSASMTATASTAGAQQATDGSDSMSSSMQGSSVLLEGGSWVQTTAGSRSNISSSAQALYESTGSTVSSAAATKADSQDAEQYTELLVAESGGDDSPDEDYNDKSSSIANVDSSRSRRSQQQLLGELSYVLCARSSSLPPMRVRGSSSSQSSVLLHPASPTAAAVAAVAAAEAQSASNNNNSSSSNIGSAELVNSSYSNSAGGSRDLQLSSISSSAEHTGGSSSREVRSPLAVSPQQGASGSGSSSARQILSPGTPRGGMSLGLLTELRGILPDMAASVGADSYSFCGDSDLGAEDAVVVGSVPPD